MNEITLLLTTHANDDTLGLSRDNINWIVSSIDQLTLEKAQIEGFVIDEIFADGLPFGMQKDYIDLYDHQINHLKFDRDLSLHWHDMTIEERVSAAIKDEEYTQESNGIYKKMFSKSDQFIKLGMVERERYNSQKELLDLREESLKKTNGLAKVGLYSGVALFIIMVSYKLFWRKDNRTTNNSSKRSRRRH